MLTGEPSIISRELPHIWVDRPSMTPVRLDMSTLIAKARYMYKVLNGPLMEQIGLHTGNVGLPTNQKRAKAAEIQNLSEIRERSKKGNKMP